MSNFELKFQNLKLKDHQFHNSFKLISLNISNLEQNFNNLIKKYKNKKSINGLDELYFQKCMIINEKNTLLNFYALILNRIYGDYYKIYKSLNLFLKQNNIEYNNSKLKIYRIYNNLNLTDQYNLDEIENLYSGIIEILEILNEFLEIEKTDLKENIKIKKGLNINNFIITLQEDINSKTNKITKFNEYINYLVYLHSDYFEKIEIKINLILDLYNIDDLQSKNDIPLKYITDNDAEDYEINMEIKKKNTYNPGNKSNNNDQKIIYKLDNGESIKNEEITENLEENVITGNLEENVITENLEESVITENLEENVITENLEENVITENLEENVITENLEENVITENLEENVITENLEENVITENLEENVITENLEENVITEN